MGLHHDRYVIGVPVEGSSYGYVNQRAFEPDAPESARWRTIMSYYHQCEEVGGFECSRVAHFSNPEVTYISDPTGVPEDHPSTGVDGPADAVNTLNERREITANFRRSSTSPTPRVHLTLSPYWLAENGGVSTVRATLHRPSSADTTVTVLASPSDAVTLSANGVLTIPAGQTVSSGGVTFTGVDNGNQTGDVSVEISATAANPSSLGVIAPKPVELVIADDETTPQVKLSLSRTEIIEGEESGDLNRTLVTATLDGRSNTETTVMVSASPAEAVEIWADTLTIPAGQTAASGDPVPIVAVDDSTFTIAEKDVTVSGSATNNQGVSGPESVTLTIIDDEGPPRFLDDSVSHTFTAGIPASRALPEASYGTRPLTYSISPALSNDVTFTPGPPARIGISSTSVAADETSYTLTVTDTEGRTDTMVVGITVLSGVCPDSAAVSGYTNPGIVNDCEALLASKHILDGSGTLNWSEDLPMSDWQGVSIADNRVVELALSGLRLAGGIPAEFGNLTNLQELHLSGNRLTGGIPAEFGNLTSLQELYLSGNRLTGGIPAEFGNLTNLQELHLSSNRLTGGIPAELGNLTNLQELHLSGNRLTGEIPAELGSLVNLRLLHASGSLLTHLGSNRLTGGIPAELGNLANLRSLDLWGNQLSGPIPTELGSLSNLERLILGRNQLSGPIPAELGNLSNLERLILAGNQFTGCIPDGLTSVEENDLGSLGLQLCSDHSCAVEGAVSDGANNPGLVSDCLTLLEALDTLTGGVTLNWATDVSIAEWEGITVGETSKRVTRLDLPDKELTGEIPSQLGSLPKLEWLDLARNRLTGVIPAELGGLSNLEGLFLSGNQLMGCISDELRDLPSNDFADVSLQFCSEHPCLSEGAVTDANNPGLMSDCATLLAARDTLVGTATLNWVAATPITQWDGVTVDGTPQRVTELIFNDWGLGGEIPKELGTLTGLQQLSLWKNQLTGEIPTELGDLSNLRELSLSSNQLTGEIPAELGDLSNLRSLSLSSNQLTGDISSELGRLATLTELYLSSNKLTGEIPTELGDLSNLRELSLSSNQLEGELPTELGDLSNLRTLNLSSNQLTGDIPSELGRLATLTGLYLSSNQLTGEIPTELGDLSDLRVLNLSHNQLTGEIPAELGNLSSLLQLELIANQLEGEIPDELGNLANLRWLLLWENQLEGEIPTELGDLSNLRALSLSSNQLTGDIPSELGRLATLTGLYLSSNQLEGEIPTELGDLSNLQRLDLDGNQLTGEIPTELGDLSNLQRLDLDGNQLTGEIPTELGDLSNLQRLDLDGNQLTGEIPEELGDLANLQGLNLSDNQLTGEIPVELGSLKNLQHLRLSENVLNGEIPTAFGSLSDLRMLSLYDNQLTGEIPVELGKLPNLLWLELPSNELTGEIPRELGNLPELVVLSLWGNRLTGAIPMELENLYNLRTLWLSGNSLSGCIPVRLGDVPNSDLEWLDLQFCSASSPEAPTIDTVTPGEGTLSIVWSAPSNHGGTVITMYDLRYIETGADETVDSNWTVKEDVWTMGRGELQYTLGGLTADTEYDVQVRAINSVGGGPWSGTATGTPEGGL